MSDDLPSWAISLGRIIVRDCRSPGRYTITLIQPQYPSEPVQIAIDKVEAIRKFTADKRKPRR